MTDRDLYFTPPYLLPIIIMGLLLCSCSGGKTTKPPSNLLPLMDTRVSTYICSLHEDKAGNLWIGTLDDGVARYDGDTLIYFDTDDGLPGNVISSITTDRNQKVWVAGHNGLSYLSGGRFVTILESEGQHDTGVGWVGVSADRDTTLWVTTREHIYRLTGDGLDPFVIPIDTAAILEYSISRGDASLLLHDSKGRYWFAPDGYGLLVWDPSIAGEEAFTRYTSADGLPSNTVNVASEDSYGRVWIGCMQAYQPTTTGDGGLCYWYNGTITTLDSIDGLHHNDLYTVYVDDQQTLWVGGTGTGLYRYALADSVVQDDSWMLYDETDRMDHTSSMGIADMLTDSKGITWLAMSGGLFRINGSQIEHVSREDLGW